MQNLEAVGNAALGGNIVTILARTIIRAKAKAAALAFRARAAQLQVRGGEVEYISPEVYLCGIPISVKKQEAYTYRADITQHAVESGANLTDHVILQPVRIDVSFEITNWDLANPQQAHDLLVKLWEDRTPLDLLTFHSVMKDMIMTSYSAENSVPNWGALECRASFTQLKFIAIESIKFPEEKVSPTENTGGTDVSKSAVTEKNTGRQTPKEIMPNQTVTSH